MSHAQAIRGRALVFGEEANLLESRRKLLLADGYMADVAPDVEELRRLLTENASYQILVVCHTVGQEAWQLVTNTLSTLRLRVPVYRMRALASPSEFLREVARCSEKPMLLTEE